MASGSPDLTSEDPVAAIESILGQTEEFRDLASDANEQGTGREVNSPSTPDEPTYRSPDPPSRDEIDDTLRRPVPEEDGELPAAAEGEEGAPQDPVDDDIRSVTQLAAEFDVAEEDFLTAIRVPGRTETEEVPLSQVIQEWRAGEGNLANHPAVVAEVQKIEAQRGELEQQYGLKAQRLQQYLDAMVMAVAGEDDVDWEQLKRELPADEYLAKSDLFQKRRKSFQDAYQHLEGAREESQKRATEVAEAESAREFEALMRARPEWREKAKMGEAMERLQGAASSIGFSDDELRGVVDHRIFLALDLVSQQLNAQKIRNEKLPGLRKLPRVSARSAARRGEGAERRDLKDRALAVHRERGDVDSGAAAIMALTDL